MIEERKHINNIIKNDVPYKKFDEEFKLELKSNIKHPMAFNEKNYVRRHKKHEYLFDLFPVVTNSDYDIDMIMSSRHYSKLFRKTQTFSLRREDDITYRGQHIQYVSQIARFLGRVLGLNVGLIEAIAIGHDIGHTPFGHLGERILNEISLKQTGKVFKHNLNAVRILDKLYKGNLGLHTLDGIFSHSGQKHIQKPKPIEDFSEFDEKVQKCQKDYSLNVLLIPSTLEACVVKIADNIAYLGRDRIDAYRLGYIKDEKEFKTNVMGITRDVLVNNLLVDVVEHSYMKPYIAMSEEMFNDFELAKKQNLSYFGCKKNQDNNNKKNLELLLNMLFEKFYDDLNKGNENSKIFTNYIFDFCKVPECLTIEEYMKHDKTDIVLDYISSLSDDYCLNLFYEEFPNTNIEFQVAEYQYE